MLYCAILPIEINYLKSIVKLFWQDQTAGLHDFCFSFGFMGGNDYIQTSGIKLLVEKYRKEFRIAENLDHYSAENYKIAERKFLKFALTNGDSKDFAE